MEFIRCFGVIDRGIGIMIADMNDARYLKPLPFGVFSLRWNSLASVSP